MRASAVWPLLFISVSAAAQNPELIKKANVRVKPAIPDTAAPTPPEILNGCPLEGVANSLRRQQSNSEKNRTRHPQAADIDSSATMAAIMKAGDDRDRWSEMRAASIVGYVVEVKRGSRETVNCDATDPAFMDTHIALAGDSSEHSEMARLIAEVTPRWRSFMAQHGADWSTDTLHRTLLHHWVRVTGWLFWDYEHANASEHTWRSGYAWRATAWEIHPVTAIKVCAGTPENC